MDSPSSDGLREQSAAGVFGAGSVAVAVVDGEQSAQGRVGGPGGEVVGIEQPAVEIAAVAVRVLSTKVLSASASAAAGGR
jgi:hypothetical protein